MVSKLTNTIFYDLSLKAFMGNAAAMNWTPGCEPMSVSVGAPEAAPRQTKNSGVEAGLAKKNR